MYKSVARELFYSKQVAIERIVAHAYQRVPYYASMNLCANIDSYEKFSALPILNKQILNQNSELLISEEINKSDLMLADDYNVPLYPFFLEGRRGYEGRP